MSSRAHAVAEVRRAEQALMSTLPAGALMERAATGLAIAVTDLLGATYGQRVGMLVGGGNNGGDALYAGARLAARGAQVEAVLLSPGHVHATGLRSLRRAGGRVVERLTDCEVVLDGIVGIGGRPGLDEPALAHVAAIPRERTRVVAVDVPSGIDVDGGTSHRGTHVEADLTVTFGTHKLGLLAGPSADAAGTVRLVDIGLDEHLGAPVLTTAGSDLLAGMGVVPDASAHKYTRGVVGVAAGSTAYTGAGLLVVAGASCGLAGMIRYVGPEEVAGLIRARHPEAVVGEGRVQAWVVGSGGGHDAAHALRRAYDDGVPVVVDADALQHLTGPPPVPVLLTPHAGELARMLDTDRDEVERDPVRHVREAADRFGGTVLLKGARTLVASHGQGELMVNTTGTPWLATAGAGDVLAGLCGALAAAAPAPSTDLGRVAALAAHLHGRAAVAAGRGGPITAGDVAAALPAVIRAAIGAAAVRIPR
ncbi:MAG: NAD(P)H-hydrate epimerase [Nocardioidaceae bacterium]|jgi:hydroxyethylthiazole kinase-like uncharacterized protein yjeF|nr:NAD(P)H-hydrate epimerase [Nocardioidaceae bacterium]